MDQTGDLPDHSPDQEAALSATKPKSSRRKIIGCLIGIVSVIVLFLAASWAMLNIFMCRHCYAYAGTPAVAKAVLSYYVKMRRLPTDYTELQRAKSEGIIDTDVPKALYKDKWV